MNVGSIYKQFVLSDLSLWRDTMYKIHMEMAVEQLPYCDESSIIQATLKNLILNQYEDSVRFFENHVSLNSLDDNSFSDVNDFRQSSPIYKELVELKDNNKKEYLEKYSRLVKDFFH